MAAASTKSFNEVKPFRQYFYYTWLIWAYGMFLSLHAQYLLRKNILRYIISKIKQIGHIEILMHLLPKFS